MRILFISFYSKPENTSSSYYVDDLKKELIKNGHYVCTIAPNPVRDLPKNVIEEYSSKGFESTESGDVFRVFVNKDTSNSIFSRVKRMFIFKKKVKKFIENNHCSFDCIFYYSNPPIFIPISAGKLCERFNLQSVYQVNDIWPDISGKYSFLKPLAKKAIKLAKHVVTISCDMRERLKKVQPNCNVAVMRIWPYEISSEDKTDVSLIKKIQGDTRFKVSYIGNIGEFQNIDLLFKTAVNLAEDKNIAFYFVGGGRLSNSLREKIAREKMTNIIFIDRVNNSTAHRLYELSDLNIISLNKNAIFYCCPSKTSSCVLSHSDCLLITDDSLYSTNLVRNYGFYHSSSFDSLQIAELIIEISKRQVKNRIYVNRCEFDKTENLLKWLDFFNKIEHKDRG